MGLSVLSDPCDDYTDDFVVDTSEIDKRLSPIKIQWRNDRAAEGGSCPRAQQARGRKIGGAKVGFMQFVESAKAKSSLFYYCQLV